MLNVKRKKSLKLLWFLVILFCWWLHGWFSGLSGVEIKNMGVSFGLGGDWVVGVNLVLLLWLGYFAWKENSWGIWLILVGGGVNLIDRLVWGYVRDYWWLGPVYNNIADWIISLGVGIFIWELWKKKLK